MSTFDRKEYLERSSEPHLNEKMKQIKSAIIVISLWTFVTVLNVMSTTNINWTKYHFEDVSNGITCSSTEYLFTRNDVPDEMACSKICFMDNRCFTSVYQPKKYQCVGCGETSFKPLETDSIQFTRRDFNVDCKDILAKNKNAGSGVYKIRLLNLEVINVYCDMTTDGGGWTVIQKKSDGNTSFNKNFEAYENGFGDVDRDFWLGLRYIQVITNKSSEFSFIIRTLRGTRGYGKYGKFKLLGADYILSLESKIQVNAERIGGFYNLHFSNSHRFITKDKDTWMKCATNSGGGWWYESVGVYPDICIAHNLNGNDGGFNETAMMVRRI